MAQKGQWNLLQDRGALPKEEGDSVREYKARHGEHFLSTWLREDLEGMEERKEGHGQKGQRGGKQKW